MRIAQISQLYEATPPKFYGGTERVVSWLTDSLVDLGHEVTLFASGDSVTKAKLVPIIRTAIRLDEARPDPNALNVKMLETVRRHAADFDVLHFHIDALPFPLFTRQPTRFLTTLHGRLNRPEYVDVYSMFPSVPLVSISNAQRRPIPGLNWIGTVYHGMPEQLLRPSHAAPEYLAFLGRISPEKGIAGAIDIAKAAGRKLKIAAKVDDVDKLYFETEIEPRLDADIVFIKEIDDSQKSDFLSRAVALLFPIAWPEPFGLTMIEAMACGTPVIAFNPPDASVPEVIEVNKTGFIVSSVMEAVAAIPRAAALDRAAIRASFEARFTSSRMAANYVTLYERMLETPPATTSTSD